MAAPTSSDPLDVLLAHNHWATRVVLEKCCRLTPEQFQHRFPIGPGSLHDTLTHIVGAMRRWTDRFAERGLRPPLEPAGPLAKGSLPPPARTPDELVVLLDEAAQDLASVARARPMESLVHVAFGEKTYTFTRGAAIMHVLTHGEHHRAQCLNMIRHLGVAGLSENLPEIDVLDWQAVVETGEAGEA